MGTKKGGKEGESGKWQKKKKERNETSCRKCFNGMSEEISEVFFKLLRRQSEGSCI